MLFLAAWEALHAWGLLPQRNVHQNTQQNQSHNQDAWVDDLPDLRIHILLQPQRRLCVTDWHASGVSLWVADIDWCLRTYNSAQQIGPKYRDATCILLTHNCNTTGMSITCAPSMQHGTVTSVDMQNRLLTDVHTVWAAWHVIMCLPIPAAAFGSVQLYNCRSLNSMWTSWPYP